MNIYDILNNLNINYEELNHKAIYTVEDAINEDIPSKINGLECKNLFLKNKDNYYLLFTLASKRVDLKNIAKSIGVNHLSFASLDELKLILSLDAGTVTPLGIINDKENKVTILIDQELSGKVLMHPNINTKTISLELSDLIKVIEYLNHEYILVC